MKKIMTMALALCVGAFASNVFGACNYVPKAPKDTAWVYSWKFRGTTTEGATAKARKAIVGNCGYSKSPETCAVRVPASLKIQGYTWACSPGCGDTFGEFAETSEVFWSTKPENYSLAGGVQVEVMNIIGKTGKKAEVGGVADLDGPDMKYDLVFAGLGKYDRKQTRLSSASGNFAGFGQPCDCASSDVWDCESLTIKCGENPNTVVYGKWNVKFNKKAAKKYYDNGVLPKWPAWVRPVNSEE